MANNVILLGAQWGDEGKGKLVDYLTDHVQAVVRFQGGHNAGHTVFVGNKKTVLHLLPSGILRPEIKNYIGSGVVFSPQAFLSELQMLKSQGVSVKPENLGVSDTASLLLPYHAVLDQAREKFLATKAIGTTGRGIGPAYVDKAARLGIRVGDLRSPEIFKDRFKEAFTYHNFILQNYYNAPSLDFAKMQDEVLAMAESIVPFLLDLPQSLNQHRLKGEKILFEGAQGTLLDIDHGTYPFVTSSNTVSGSAATGTGFGPLYMDCVLGVIKAYITRVGAGPMPTELNDEIGAKLAKKGDEFGATTQRARRCGWLDLVLLKRAVFLNSISVLGVTKLDVLDGMESIKVCVGYRLGGRIIDVAPSSLEDFTRAEPVYETLPGWKQPTAKIRAFEDLPKEAVTYLNYIADFLELPISMVATGQERHDIIVLEHPFS